MLSGLSDAYLYKSVSVLFNEPKLLKSRWARLFVNSRCRVSVLFNEPKLLKSYW